MSPDSIQTDSTTLDSLAATAAGEQADSAAASDSAATVAPLTAIDDSFFVGRRDYHPAQAFRSQGVAGQTLPYAVGRDDVITVLLLGCFIIAAVAVARSRSFIVRHLRGLVYVPRSEAEAVETGNEVRFQLVLCLQTSLLVAIVFYIYIRYADGFQTSLATPLLPIAAFTGVNVLYLMVKWLAYQAVNRTFFDGRRIGRWERLRLFLTAGEGVLLFPMMVVQIYLGLPFMVTVFYALFIVILVKILTFYKAQTIFFKGTGGFVQNILYFCTLEMMPLGALWGVQNMVQHYLKVNF